MNIAISDNSATAGDLAAKAGAELIRRAVETRGTAGIILATGTAQIPVLERLVREEGIEWGKVTAFHLDEYIGISRDHPASFRRYLEDRFVRKIPSLGAIHFIDGSSDDPELQCRRLGARLAETPIDVAFVGIGENGHLAFNDPPADFETDAAFIVVELDEKCRKQQLGEGWFEALSDVPGKAISMTIRQICRSAAIICTVTDLRKAEAVRCSVQGPITNMCPASILQGHHDCRLFLDNASASLLAGSLSPDKT